MAERFQLIRIKGSELGRMAQLVEPTGQVIKLPVHEYLK